MVKEYTNDAVDAAFYLDEGLKLVACGRAAVCELLSGDGRRVI